jgi:hypothetical protein
MSPTTVREVLIAEVIGDVGGLIDRAEALVKTVEDVCVALARADAALGDQLVAFEGRVAAMTENAKTQTVRHLAAHAQEATRRSIEVQSRAMVDAARVAFGAEIGSTMQRLQALLKPRVLLWERCLTHAAAAAAGSAVTWALVVYLGAR